MKRLLLFTLCLFVVFAAGYGGLAVANADGLEFEAFLTGTTMTTGEVKLDVDATQTAIQYKLKVKNAQGILGKAGAHLHCGPAGANGPIIAFLAGPVTGGLNGDVEIEATLTAANIIKSDTSCGATIAALVQAMSNGNVYANVPSSAFPNGVVRGQLLID